MSRPDTEALLGSVRTLLGGRVLNFYRVNVVLAGEQVALDETLVLCAESPSSVCWLQLLTDHCEPTLRAMGGKEDYVILGEYSDRESDSLEIVDNSWTPFVVDHVVAVWQRIGRSGESLLALVFYAPDGVSSSILFDNDDILLVSAERVWRYVLAILPHAREVRAEPLEGKQERKEAM